MVEMVTAVDLLKILSRVLKLSSLEDMLTTLLTFTLSTQTPGQKVMHVNQNHKLGNQSRSVCITANPLPKPIQRAAIVPFDNSFLLTGGLTDPFNYLKDIYQYNSNEDEWIKLESELQTARAFHVALLVPQSLFPECP